MINRLLPVRYFAKPGGGSTGLGNRWGWLSRADFAAPLLAQLPGFDVYLTLNPSTGTSARPVLGEIAAWRGLVVDVDPAPGVPSLPPDDPMLLGAIHLSVCGMLMLDLAPAVLFTGRGYQLWYLFPPVAPPPPGAARAMRTFLVELDLLLTKSFPFLHVDPACSDLCRLVRFPASVNQKTHQKVVTLDVGTPSADDRNIPGVLLRWLPDDEPARSIRAATPVPGGSPWGMYLPRLTEKAALYLSEGTTAGGRHDCACATAFSLRENGCSEPEILAALLYGNAMCDEPLPERELIRILTTTQRRFHHERV